MAVYVAVKFPALIVLVLLCNGLLNALLATVLGSGLSFRQTGKCLLIAFSTTGIILASLSPIALVQALNCPPPEQVGGPLGHSLLLLTHTGLIAFAGVVAHAKQLRLLTELCPSPKIAKQTFFAWIGGSLFVGAQLSWILRPWFGSTQLEVAFLRPDPLRGDFYNAVWRSATHLFARSGLPGTLLGWILTLSLLLLLGSLLRTKQKPI
ncbi:MAG: hypothetical protein AAF555_00225 [Verrucomicrobiota bacterium]